jgi:16S rRNA C967 or C1407 C5-methylase (RsmB/RsmF family)
MANNMDAVIKDRLDHHRVGKLRSAVRGVTWAEITKWLAMSLNSHWFEIAATRIMPAKWLTELVERDLKKGTRYWSVEGRLWSEENPDAYAGVHNFDGVMLIFDEASGIPDSIWSVSDGFLQRIHHIGSIWPSPTRGATQGISTRRSTASGRSGIHG